MPVRLKYVSYLIPFLHWWAEFFSATKLAHLCSWRFMYLKKYVYLDERNKQSEYLIFWLVNRLEQTIHLNKYIHLNCLVQFILLKGNNTQTSLSEALRRHLFINRYFAHLFEESWQICWTVCLRTCVFLTGFCCCCQLFSLFVFFVFCFFQKKGQIEGRHDRRLSRR